MRFIPTRIHGFLDYGVALLLIISPWILGFANDGAETWVPVVIGVGAILYSAITDYELSIARLLPMRGHLALDIASGLFLAASPWLFNFDELVYLPHLLFGLLEIGAAVMTDPNRRTFDEMHQTKYNSPGSAHHA
ncbi:MAG TPA: SPW repeat protein [Tepidisphaeraceae bacterium]|jgi:hypothetical protein|nr:SPW repeat protein [Tepidisphaeraceae bacterium]